MQECACKSSLHNLRMTALNKSMFYAKWAFRDNCWPRGLNNSYDTKQNYLTTDLYFVIQNLCKVMLS